MNARLTLSVLNDVFAVCRLDAQSPIPAWAMRGEFFSATRAQDGISIVCLQGDVPEGIRCERGWRCLKVEGPLDFSLVGILNSITAPLACAEVSIFAISTFDTDYILVRERDLERATSSLIEAGHHIL
jgi:hypothetical protein